ncbi:MAG: hypothetical protein P8Y28_10440, partial [Gammaproteobacteria bacterium]
MKYFGRSNIFIVFLILSGFLVSTTYAEEAQKQLDAASIIKKLDSVELELDREKVQVDKLNEYMLQLPGFSSWSRNCVQSTEKELGNINDSLATLGDAVKGESEGVVKKRKSLLNEKINLDKKLA